MWEASEQIWIIGRSASHTAVHPGQMWTDLHIVEVSGMAWGVWCRRSMIWVEGHRERLILFGRNPAAALETARRTASSPCRNRGL